MRKGFFGRYLAIFMVIVGVFYVMGAIGEPKCIKAGCGNKQASGVDDAEDDLYYEYGY